MAATSKDRLGIGDILLSPLDQTRFQGQHGGKTNEWVLCDGGKYPGSAYAKLMGRDDVPDFRSRYPRGADSTQQVLKLLDASIPNHTHQLSGWGVMPDCRGGGDNQVLRTGYGGDTITSGVREGALLTPENENRPKTTVINFYIRIN